MDEHVAAYGWWLTGDAADWWLSWRHKGQSLWMSLLTTTKS